ncbi:MAG TPA: TM2 domain-containing protein [Candidatus Omnitrophica bacterium]|nr:TM2 domain-containing protein [Candidatus Omnitrophota bacterium]
MKSVGVAYLLWLFLGGIGIHKFYLGKTGWGIAYLLGGDIFGIGWLVDLFTLPGQVRAANERKGEEVKEAQQSEVQEGEKESK